MANPESEPLSSLAAALEAQTAALEGLSPDDLSAVDQLLQSRSVTISRLAAALQEQDRALPGELVALVRDQVSRGAAVVERLREARAELRQKLRQTNQAFHVMRSIATSTRRTGSRVHVRG